jgi:hypothetical protein
MEILIDERCACLDKSECVKRKFEINDIFSEITNYNYYVCNDLIRLKLHEITMENCYQNYRYYLGDVICELLSKYKKIYQPIKFKVFNNVTKAKDIFINFNFIERPYVLRSITLGDALELYKENYLYSDGLYTILDAITDFYNNNTNNLSIHFSKSKIIGGDKFKKLLKQVKESFTKEEKEISLNNLMIFTLETKLKTK